MNSMFQRAAVAAFVCSLAIPAQAAGSAQPDVADMQPASSNTSSPSNWRITPGMVLNGVVGALDGVVKINFRSSAGPTFCSGSLLQGGAYVLTAAHCADNFQAMTVEFGYFGGTSVTTRTVAVGDAILHPLWRGFVESGDRGVDVALLKLDSPVTTIRGYGLSHTNDLGKTHLIAGFGASGVGSLSTPPNMDDGAYGHWGYNTFDVDSATFKKAFNTHLGRSFDPDYYVGLTYMVDYDNANFSNTNNTLGRIGVAAGGAWSSSTGLGATEALMAAGDSGGGDFVWDANSGSWLLSAVHSWNWDGNAPCSAYALSSCDLRINNLASFGDLSGSTAVVGHVDWIQSIISVPEPHTYALMTLGLMAVFRAARRKATA